ncbi:MAG: DUF4328 domain-containing protein [Planctomycetota bacterium]
MSDEREESGGGRRPETSGRVAQVFVVLHLLLVAAGHVLVRTLTSIEDPKTAMLLQGIFFRVPPFLHVGAGIATALFFFRLARWLRAGETTSRAWTWPAGAAVAWFVPVVNLVVPFLVLRELWRRLVAEDDPRAVSPLVLRLWWGLWMLRPVARAVTSSLDDTTWESLPTAFVAGIDHGFLALDVANGVLFVIVLARFLDTPRRVRSEVFA